MLMLKLVNHKHHAIPVTASSSPKEMRSLRRKLVGEEAILNFGALIGVEGAGSAARALTA